MRAEQKDSSAQTGFTLIEALVAVAVAAISLAAISSLIAGNIRGAGKIAQHLGLCATLRAVEAALPNRDALALGKLTGEMHGQTWTVDVAPFPSDFINPRANVFWIPFEILVTVQSPSGGQLQLTTVRLARISGAE
jgi:general secretion pathway protein I